MNDTFRLKVVQDLAQRQSDTAAIQLGTLNAEAPRRGEADMLITYAKIPRAIQGLGAAGRAQRGFQELQEFMVNSTEAIDQRARWCSRRSRRCIAGSARGSRGKKR